MSRYIVVHQADYEKLETIDHLVELARAIAHRMGVGVKWLNSWWASEDEVLICEWDAPDRETLDRLLAEGMDAWPVARVYEVVWSDPKWWSDEGGNEG